MMTGRLNPVKQNFTQADNGPSGAVRAKVE
jgi:hypothetical protein